MPVNLSIENAPDHVVERLRLRRRAERHHRSLQGELLAIIELPLARINRPRRLKYWPIYAGSVSRRRGRLPL
jgi:plasmid stability protein